MVLKKTAMVAIAILFSMNLIANEDVEQNVEISDYCEKQYSTCLEKCDQGTNEDAEACYDSCDLKLTDCENKQQS